MISILPEHAPPVESEETYRLIVAETCIAEFKDSEGAHAVESYSQDIVGDIVSMHQKGFGKLITYDSLQCSLEFIYVLDHDDNIHEQYTNMLHNLINHKYTLIFT